jgi:mannose/cellobiose epimerase-like protein (N-acyl-D-glucosamine 2-epimerase family)
MTEHDDIVGSLKSLMIDHGQADRAAPRRVLVQTRQQIYTFANAGSRLPALTVLAAAARSHQASRR